MKDSHCYKEIKQTTRVSVIFTDETRHYRRISFEDDFIGIWNSEHVHEWQESNKSLTVLEIKLVYLTSLLPFIANYLVQIWS